MHSAHAPGKFSAFSTLIFQEINSGHIAAKREKWELMVDLLCNVRVLVLDTNTAPCVLVLQLPKTEQLCLHSSQFGPHYLTIRLELHDKKVAALSTHYGTSTIQCRVLSSAESPTQAKHNTL